MDSLYASLIYGASQQIRFDSSGVTFNAFRIPISGVNVAHSELRGAFIPMSGSSLISLDLFLQSRAYYLLFGERKHAFPIY